MLFSMSGVVIMKMISSTNAKSSSGVTFSSLSVCSALRSENLRIKFMHRITSRCGSRG